MFLEPEEIRLLSKLNKCSVSIADAHKTEVDKFIGCGLMCYSDYRFELGKLTVAELKRIASDNGVSEKGKKTEIINVIVSAVSDDVLAALHMEKYLVLTEQGEKLLQDNSSLLLWYNGLRHEYVKPAEVIEAQKEHKGESDNDILLSLYKNRLCQCVDDLELFSLLLDIKRIYQWKNDEQGLGWVENEITETDKRLNEARERRYNSIDLDSVLGLTSEERKVIRDKALAELDENWEKEVDAKYRGMVDMKEGDA